MGVSTDAVLFYGFCWDEESHNLLADPEADGDEGDASEWQEVIARKRGLVNPWDEYVAPEGRSYDEKRKKTDAWVAARREAIDAWHAAKAAIEAEFGVEIGYHCSGDCPMPYLYVVGSRVRAYRGYAVVIDPETLKASGEWDEKLRRFAAELGIELPAGCPQWWLVSFWG